VLFTRYVSPSLSGCRLEDMFKRVPRCRQSVCLKPLTNFGSRSLTRTRGSPCNQQTPCKNKVAVSSVVTVSVHGRKWAIRVRWSTTISTVLKSLLSGKCQVVKTNGVPRSGWNMQWVKSRSHLRSNLCASTYDAALTKIFHILAKSFPPESVERFSKSAIHSFVTC
jgi:hypothetical protein